MTLFDGFGKSQQIEFEKKKEKEHAPSDTSLRNQENTKHQRQVVGFGKKNKFTETLAASEYD